MKKRTMKGNKKIILIGTLLLSMVCFGGMTSAVFADAAVTYLDAVGTEQSCAAYTTVDASTTSMSEGWYVVSGEVTVTSRIEVSDTGDGVHLILEDDSVLNATKGIELHKGSKLTIYGQAESSGSLVATGDSINYKVKAWVWKNDTYPYNKGEYYNNEEYGSWEYVEHTAGNAGIGSSANLAPWKDYDDLVLDDDIRYSNEALASAGELDINGGIVTSTGGSSDRSGGGAGIGGGARSDGGEVTVNGGRLNANGGSEGGAGIGGGGWCWIGPRCTAGNGGSLTVNGGYIDAKGSNGGAGIGGGEDGPGGTFRITGGEVVAEAGGWVGNGIGGGWACVGTGEASIQGGKITVTPHGYENKAFGNVNLEMNAEVTVGGQKVKYSELGTALEETEKVVEIEPCAMHQFEDDACIWCGYDEYPVKKYVTFRVVNGSWDDDADEDRTVTLKGKEGDDLKLSSEQIPAVGSRPKENYKAGSWDAEPDADTEITGDVVYTYTYAQKDSINHAVTFKVVNGSWNEGEGDAAKADKTVTLTGYEGDTLKLSADQLPAVGDKPNDGYKVGSWDVEPSTDATVEHDAIHTYTYEKKDSTTKGETSKDDENQEPQTEPVDPSSGRNDDHSGDKPGEITDSQAETNQKAADAVNEALEALPEEIDLSQEDAVATARSVYEALTEAQKALVPAAILEKLTHAEQTITDWKEYTADVANSEKLTTVVVKVKNTKGKKATITWKKATGNTGYQIHYSVNKKFKKNVKTKTVKKAGMNKITLKKLKKGKTYYVQVRTYTTVTNRATGETSKVYGDWSKTKKVKVKR